MNDAVPPEGVELQSKRELVIASTYFRTLFKKINQQAAKKAVDGMWGVISDRGRGYARQQYKIFYGVEYQPPTGGYVDNSKIKTELAVEKARADMLQKKLEEMEAKMANQLTVQAVPEVTKSHVTRRGKKE